jgi:cytochrome c2
MWNHSPEMIAMSVKEKIPYPIMERKDMADLIAYIFTTRYFTVKGDAAKGKIVFQEKKCSDCHMNSGGPPLKFFQGRCTSSYMITELWNHGPIMEKKLLSKGYQWPKLTEAEMVDLLAYLNEGS